MEFFLIHLKKSRFIENNGFFFIHLKKSRFIENNWFFWIRLKKSQFIDLLKKSQFIDNKLRLWLWRHHLSAGPEQKSQFIDLLKKVAKGAKIVKGAKGVIYAVPYSTLKVMFYDRDRWCSGKIDWRGNTHSWGNHNVKVEFYGVTWLWSRDGWYKKTTFLFTTQCQICP